MSKKSKWFKALDLAASTLFKKMDAEGYVSIIIIIASFFVVLITQWKKIKKEVKKISNF